MENLSFEQKLLQGLKNCGVHSNGQAINIGAGVSGGADSVSLLLGLCSLSSLLNLNIHVVCVNHFIRSDEETCGDADFVQQLCTKLVEAGFSVKNHLIELKKGSVKEMAEKNGGGIEDAARKLRYSAFEKVIESEKIDYFCLAHNKNDQLETLLMRFIKGSGLDGLTGISLVRNHYIRPMLDISRNEIEEYLKLKNQEWRTDNTNFDTDYLRNKIRHKIVPVLNKEFSDWQSGLLTGQKKLQDDKECLLKEAQAFSLMEEVGNENKTISFDAADFSKLPKAIAIRVLVRCFNRISDVERISSVFMSDLIEEINKNPSKSVIKKYYEDFEISLKNGRVFVKKHHKYATDLNFFDIIEESLQNERNYDFPFGTLCIRSCNVDGNSAGEKESANFDFFYNEKKVLAEVKLPVVVRSVSLDDEIKTSEGTYKKVLDIYSDWHVNEEDRWKIPVIQEIYSPGQELICILGSVCGFKDWIVKK